MEDKDVFGRVRYSKPCNMYMPGKSFIFTRLNPKWKWWKFWTKKYISDLFKIEAKDGN